MTEAEMIERCANQIYSHDHNEDELWAVKRVLEATGIPLAVLAALASGEWQAVPREPTEAMHRAGRIITDMPNNSDIGRVHTWATQRWAEVLAAAPPSPAREDGA